LGLSPKVIFCRSPQPLLESTKQKISLFCHVPAEHVLSVHDVKNVYHVPGLLQEQGLHAILGRELGLVEFTPDLDQWNAMARSIDEAVDVTTIALIGKYTGLQDSYLSVIKALRHAAIACNVRLNLEWVEASMLESQEEEAWSKVREADGIIVPGGFGQRGWQGKILAAEYCRTHSKPYLGVCLGFQAMVVEFCRNILGWEDANSTEIDENTTHPAVLFMPEIDKTTMGGTMRLGARTTTFTHTHADGSTPITQILYGKSSVVERHRHRYEVNPEYVDTIHNAGLALVGRDDNRMEIAELPTHPYYVGCQFHPEFTSRPLHPSPPFLGLVLAACGKLEAYLVDKKKQQQQSS
jgi:CTP synthase